MGGQIRKNQPAYLGFILILPGVSIILLIADGSLAVWIAVLLCGGKHLYD